MSPAALEARALGKRFDRHAALADLDLRLEPGQSLALLGPNGAGKSTFLRLVAGLTRPSSGELRVAGQPAHHPATRARIGFVADRSFLYPQLSARENLIFAARLYGVAAPGRRADQLLEEEGLRASGDRLAGGFSRGMSQRLALARGRVHDPEILLLDEPWSGLDRSASERLAGRLEQLRGAGRSVVLVTHDLGRAVALSDRAVVLARGRALRSLEGDSLRLATLEEAYAEAEAA